MRLGGASQAWAERASWIFDTNTGTFETDEDRTHYYTQTLTAGWRYMWRIWNHQAVVNVLLEVRVTRPDGIEKRLDTTDSESCYQNGIPTPSKSPSPTISQSPSPTRSRTQSPSPTPSSEFSASARCSSSAVFDASRPADCSARRAVSLGFVASRDFTPSSSFTSGISHLDRHFRVFRLALFSFAELY
jgi:hypothetical protein